MVRVNLKTLEREIKALANRRRLAILSHLKQEGEVSVGDIAAAIRLSVKATSKHLGLMLAADLLEREQRGLLMFYRLNPSINKPISYIISNL